MKKCCICGKEHNAENSISFGIYSNLCDTCASRIEILQTKGRLPQEKENAKNYLNGKINAITDMEERRNLLQAVDNLVPYKSAPKSAFEKKSQFDKEWLFKREDWINGARTITTLPALGMAIAGFCLGLTINFFVGLLCGISGLLLGFVMVSVTMVLINAAESIEELRKYICDENNLRN